MPIKRKTKKSWIAGLILGSILLNIGISQAASSAGIVLYLDSIGTVIASIFGGFLPGILVGFITNLIKTIFDPSSIYYGLINVLIAVFAAFFASHGWFKNVFKIFVPVVATGIFVGGLSSILTWALYGFATEGISADLASTIYSNTFFSMFGSQLSADILIDLIDKLITFYVAFAIYRLIPKKVSENFTLTNWQQDPLSQEMLKIARTMNVRSLSLRVKIIIVLVPSMFLIAIASTLISYRIYVNMTVDDRKELATTIADLETAVIDPDRVDEYIEKGKNAPGYRNIEQRLTTIRESSEDIEYVYIYRILEDGYHVVFDLDTPELKGAAPGDIVAIEDSFKPYLNDLLEGKEIEPLIYEDRYGWLMTVYKPVYDSEGKCQCYACVDVSMDKLYGNGTIFLAKLFSLFFGLFILILAVGLWLTKYHIIFPVNTISYSVSHFAHENAQAMEEQVKEIHKLAIGTGDEVENLYHAVSKLADDDLQYSLDIQRKNEVIMQMQSGLIIILADLVESRDKCTGDHVRKTAAYVKIIMRQMKILDIYADQLTDEFVRNVGDSAPLHDVGKIHVPDAILNKAGRLTDEEFTIMKEHTTAGAEILDRAIELVPDTGYLREAKNLALYHHEKWNGSGYPMGLAGEDIPLSARIMAVADVFDALVSKRSYKEGMPFEKAMSIITEGAGSHFDAEIVRAFESAEEEVREVSLMHMDQSAGGLII